MEIGALSRRGYESPRKWLSLLAVEQNDLQTQASRLSAQVYLWISHGCIFDQEHIVFLFEFNHLTFPWNYVEIS